MWLVPLRPMKDELPDKYVRQDVIMRGHVQQLCLTTAATTITNRRQRVLSRSNPTSLPISSTGTGRPVPKYV